MFSPCCNILMYMEGNEYPPEYRCYKCGQIYVLERQYFGPVYTQTLKRKEK